MLLESASRRLESIDIAGAFLKGFSFSEIQRALREAWSGCTKPSGGTSTSLERLSSPE